MDDGGVSVRLREEQGDPLRNGEDAGRLASKIDNKLFTEKKILRE